MADRYWVGGSGTWNTTTTNWSATSGGASGASAPTSADNVFFNGLSNTGTGAFTVTIGTANVTCLNLTVSGLDGAMTLALASRYIIVSGNWSNQGTNFSVTSVAGGISFQPAAATTRTITSNAISFPAAATIELAGSTTGTLQLSGALTHLGTFFWTAGTLDLNGFTFTTGIFQSSGSSTKAITFGSANIVLNSNTAGATVLSMGTATGFTWTGTGGFVRNQRATATFNFGGTSGATVSNAPNLTFNSVTSTSTLTSFSSFKNLDFSTSTCIVNNSSTGSINIAGVLSLNNSTGASTIYQGFIPAFLVTATLDSAKALGGLGIAGTGITVTLARATTVISTGQAYINAGTLALNGFNLTTGSFVSGDTFARSVAFGSNNIILSSTTAATTVLSFANAFNFSWTGTGGFVRNQAATATVTFGTSNGTASNAPNLTVNAGASALTVTNNSWLNNLIFTGSTCTVAGAAGADTTINIAGDLTLATGGTYTAVRPSFRDSSTVTTLAKTVGNTTVNGVGITVTLNDAFTANGVLSLTNGTLNLNGFTLSASTFIVGVGTKNITFNGGTISLSSASSQTWLNGSPTNFTTTAGTGVGTISLTAAGAKTFTGGGSTYNCTLNLGGAGACTIIDSNTFDNITNTVQPASVLFTAGTTNTFNSFSLSGTSGNLVTIGSVTAASHTLSKASGTVSVSFCSISYSTATGGATWQSSTSNGNVDAGNNTGWDFAGGSLFGDISELINASDLLEGVYTTFSLIDEQVSLQDTLAYAYITDSSLSESISSVDLLSATYDAFVDCTDSISLLASLSVTADFIGVYTDSISLVDLLSATYDAFVDCTDSISLTDSLSATRTMLVVCVDSISVTDSLSTIYNGIVFSTENVSVSDSQSVIANMSVAVQDSVNALSTPSGRFPWDLVQDNPEAIWQVIQTVPDVE